MTKLFFTSSDFIYLSLDASWKIRSILGQKAESFVLDKDNNYFKYLYNMATGHHYEETATGQRDWARKRLGKIIKQSAAIQDATESVFSGL